MSEASCLVSGERVMEENEDMVVNESELDESNEYPDEIDGYDAVEDENAIPLPTSPEWHGYVMGLFEEDELQDGCPTLDGLRRVTELVLGPIVESNPHVVQVPTSENNGRATVEVHLVIFAANHTLKVGDAADVYHGNTDAPFNKHPVATATSRAEARALRKVLKLRKVISAEETSVAAELEETTDFAPTPISKTQILLLNKLAKENNVNLVKFINMGETHYDKITDIKFAASVSMAEQLQKYKTEKPPKAIEGYDPNWRDTHG